MNPKSLIRSVLIVFVAAINSLVYSSYIEGSAAIILRTNEYIIVSADSKTLDRLGNEGIVNKIRYFKNSNIGYVAAGIIFHEYTNYDLHELAKNACDYPGTIFDKTDYFVKNAEPRFTKFLNFITSSTDSDIRSLTLQVAFFTITETVPLVSLVKFLPDTSYRRTKNYEIRIKQTTNDIISDSKIYFLGEYKEMHESMAVDSMIINPMKESIRLINIAIENHNNVGLPIDILMVNSIGFNWIQKK